MPNGDNRLPYMPGIDGLRAIAVLAVFFYHVVNGWMAPGGFLGVDVFFVISGYLITSLLLSEFRNAGHLEVVEFWLRRARRLLPAVAVMIAVTLLVAAIFTPATSRAPRRCPRLALLRQQLAPDPHPPVVLPGVRATFAVPAPVVAGGGGAVLSAVAAAVRRRDDAVRAPAPPARRARRRAGLDPADGHPLRPHAGSRRIFYGTDTRAVGLLLGVALAMVWHPNELGNAIGRWAAWVLDAIGVLALAVIVGAFLTIHDFEPSLYRGGFLMLAIATAALVAVLAHPAARLGRVLGSPPLLWLGLRSYSFYLWHWPILALTRPGIDVPLHGPVLVALQLGATLLLADLSYRYVEQPFRRAKRQRPAWLRLGRGRLAVAVAATVLVIGWGGIVPKGRPGQLHVAWAEITPRKAKYVVHPISVTRAVSEASGGRGPVKASARRGGRAKALPVLALGDSVMVDASQSLGRLLGPRLTLNAHVGRQASEVIDLLHRYSAHGGLPDYVVLQLGDNGPVYSDDLERLHDALKGVPHVLLVNVEVPRSWQGEVDSLLSQAADDWGQAQLVDWHAVADSHGGITTDGIHLTEKGVEFYSRLVAASVRTASKSD